MKLTIKFFSEFTNSELAEIEREWEKGSAIKAINMITKKLYGVDISKLDLSKKSQESFDKLYNDYLSNGRKKAATTLIAIYKLIKSTLNESINEAKAFDADVTKMIKQIKSGMGWIDPEFVEETWENISDTIDFSLIQKELYKRLIDAKLLAWPNPDNEEKAGVPVRRLQDVVKESLDEYAPSEWCDDITEAKVPENWIPFDLDYEVSKNRPLWLLMDSKLSSKDIAAIKAASPYAMKVGFFEVEIAMDKKPSIQSDPYDFSRVGGSKNAWVVTIKK